MSWLNSTIQTQAAPKSISSKVLVRPTKYCPIKKPREIMMKRELNRSNDSPMTTQRALLIPSRTGRSTAVSADTRKTETTATGQAIITSSRLGATRGTNISTTKPTVSLGRKSGRSSSQKLTNESDRGRRQERE